MQKTAKRDFKTESAEPPIGDFRSFLQNELIRRIEENPRYSLRAFAAYLGLESAFLSKLLRGERAVTERTITRVGQKLGLSPVEIEFFTSQKFEEKTSAQKESVELDYRKIAQDHFQILSDWYHFAILELSRVKGFDSSPRWIATRLGISSAEVSAAIERLVRLNYLHINKKGHWVLAEPNRTTVGTEVTSAALRKMQRQVLEMGIGSLETVEPELRDQTTITMAIDSRKMEKAKSLIRNFRRKMSAYLEEGTELDSVYNLSISLYPLVKPSKAKKSGEK